MLAALGRAARAASLKRASAFRSHHRRLPARFLSSAAGDGGKGGDGGGDGDAEGEGEGEGDEDGDVDAEEEDEEAKAAAAAAAAEAAEEAAKKARREETDAATAARRQWREQVNALRREFRAEHEAKERRKKELQEEQKAKVAAAKVARAEEKKRVKAEMDALKELDPEGTVVGTAAALDRAAERRSRRRKRRVATQIRQNLSLAQFLDDLREGSELWITEANIDERITAEMFASDTMEAPAGVEDVGRFDRSYDGARPYATTFFEEAQNDGSTRMTVTNAFGVDSNEAVSIVRARDEAQRERRERHDEEADSRAFQDVSWRDMLEAWDEFQGGDGAALRDVDDRLNGVPAAAADSDEDEETQIAVELEGADGAAAAAALADDFGDDVAPIDPIMDSESPASKREKKKKKREDEGKVKVNTSADGETVAKVTKAAANEAAAEKKTAKKKARVARKSKTVRAVNEAEEENNLA